MLTIELADVMLPGISDVILNKDDDLIFLTVGMYKLFLSNPGGRDARDLYLHLMFTARMQETNQVWANRVYLKEGVSLGDARLKHAKALLKKLGLIEYVRERCGKGRLSKVYIRLTKLWSRQTATGSVSDPVVKSPIQPQGRLATPVVPGHLNALSEKENTSVTNTSRARRKGSPGDSLRSDTRQRVMEHGTGDHATLTSLFFEKYTGRVGVRPAWGKKEGALLKQDLARLGAAKLATLVVLYFDDPPADVARFCEKAGSGYGVFHSQIDKLLTAQRADEGRSALLRVCPHCGKKQEHTGVDCLFCQKPLQEARHVS